MRQAMVGHARTQGARKRAGDLRRVELTEAIGRSDPGSLTTALDTIALDDALRELAEIQPRAAQVVELRYFGGLTLDETAKILEVTQKTVSRDWNVARLWLLDYLEP